MTKSLHWSSILLTGLMLGTPISAFVVPLPPLKALVFDFRCATHAQFPASALAAVVKTALTRLGDVGVKTWGDRAVSQDLNADGQLEYLVPLQCGATGNCTWGVFASGPARHLGNVAGLRVQLVPSVSGWATLLGYSALGAGEGLSQRFEMRGQGYVETDRRVVGGSDNGRVLESMGDPKCASGNDAS